MSWPWKCLFTTILILISYLFDILHFSPWLLAGAGRLWEDQKRPAGLRAGTRRDLYCVRHELPAGETPTLWQTSAQNATQNPGAVTASAGGRGGKKLHLNMLLLFFCLTKLQNICETSLKKPEKSIFINIYWHSKRFQELLAQRFFSFRW